MTIVDDFNSRANSIYSDLVKWRRHIHENPELGFDTKQTEDYIKSFLQKEKIEILPSSVGVLAYIRATTPQDPSCLALRADMDALPIEELNDVEYHSQKQGKMHACGHDAHTAMLMGAAKILNGMRDILPHSILLIFQPAEEGPLPGGAYPILKDLKTSGLISSIRAIAGQHVTTEFQTGTIVIHDGPSAASTDEMDITITGIGGHVGLPHLAIDALSVAAKFVGEMESFMSRRVSPFDSAIFGIGTLNAGTARNIIPETAEMKITIRCLKEETRALITDNAQKILKGICEAHSAEFNLDLRRGLPVLQNNSDLVSKALKVAISQVGQHYVKNPHLESMGAEDFAWYSQNIPAIFAWVGAGNQQEGITTLMHNPRFNIDEKVLPIGVAFFCGLAFEL